MKARVLHEQQSARRALRQQIWRRGSWQNGLSDWGASVTALYVLLLLVGGAGGLIFGWYAFLHIIGFFR